MELKIKKVGLTVEKDGEVILIIDGEMPPDCIVVFMDSLSWNRLKQEMPKEN